MPSRSSAEELGLYVHVPFCVHRCGYCDFVTVAGRDDLTDAYLDALAAEARRRRDPRGLATVFLGGGTPTHLSPARLRRLLGEVLAPFRLLHDAEVTSEANPESVDPARVEALLEGGVNRVSLGVQSFDDAELAAMERSHTAADAAAAVRLLREAGVPRISLDLIYGLPAQTLESFRRSLNRALELEPGHLSVYSLTLEPGAPWFRERPVRPGWTPDEDLQADMAELALETLRGAGYRAYELANFSRPGEESRHNLRYWRSLPVLALGVGAWGTDDGVRVRNPAGLDAYLADQEAGRGPVVVERMTPEVRRREEWILALRLDEGVPEAGLEGGAGARARAVLERYRGLGLVALEERSGTRAYKLTDRGRMLANTVMAELL